jgi:RHS repeat-associated protein
VSCTLEQQRGLKTRLRRRRPALDWVRASLTPPALLVLLVAMSAFGTAISPASATAAGGLKKNETGTWSLYGETSVGPLRTYSAAEAEKIAREAEAMAADIGESPGLASKVPGLTAGEKEAAASMVEELQTGQPYRSPAERNIGNSVVTQAEALGLLSTIGQAWNFTANVKVVPKTRYLEFTVGHELGRALVLPVIAGGRQPMPLSIGEFRWRWLEWSGEATYGAESQACSSFDSKVSQPAGDACVGAFEDFKAEEEVFRFGAWEKRGGEVTKSPGLISGTPLGPPAPGITYFYSPESAESTAHLGFDADKLSEAAFPTKELSARLAEVGIGGSDVVTATERSTPVLSEPSELPSLGPEGILPLLGQLIAHKREGELPGTEPGGPGVPAPPTGVTEPPGTPGPPETEPPATQCKKGKSVNCASGNESFSQTDLAVGGRGPGLSATRTYDSQLAAQATSSGELGYGWSLPYSAHTELLNEDERIVYGLDGEGSLFLREGLGSPWLPVSSLDQAALTEEGGKFKFKLPDQTVLEYNSAGLMTAERDRNGNAVTVQRNGEGRIESVTDPSGRELTFKDNGGGQIESITDPAGHTVTYTYEGGKLATVKLPGAAAASWTFHYNGSHEITSETDARGQTTEREYDGSHRVISETDPMHNTRKWEYSGSFISGNETTNVTEPGGGLTRMVFNSYGEPTRVTRGYETALATTVTYVYGLDGLLLSTTDGRGNTITYTYDGTGDRISENRPATGETRWGYDGTHDVTSVTTPNGETTTIKRDERGNTETIERPAPGAATQKTNYEYTAHGQLESVEDPLKHVWKYEYDSAGDRIAGTGPENDECTWGYDEDSNVTSSVSPRGNVEGAEASKYTTKTERDAQERPKKITDPLGHTTKYTYDGDGNLETLTDANGHTTTYTYDADNEPTKIEQPNGDSTETEYDSENQVISQTDGNEHTTKYERNILGELTEVEDPLKRKTTREYNTDGLLTKLTDPSKRTTTYKYDQANQLSEVKYSEESTPSVEYEYDDEGNRTRMEDGTGTSTYAYDQLGRTTETRDGHGDVVKYQYDLADDNTKITYPNGKAVTRTYDNAGRLETVEDWLEHTTTFSYDPDSDLTKTDFPSNEDKYAFNEAGQQTKVEMKKSAETLATLTYTRDNLGQVKTAVQTGLPGPEEVKYSYDEDSRLTKDGASEYKYDAADNATTTPGSTNAYDASSELEKGTNVEYAYDELGERTKRNPSSGPATTYGDDQAGDLSKVERPAEGEVAEIKDDYGSDGAGLRASQTINGTTNFMAWDSAEGLPLLLTDGTNSYIYGPGGSPVEQVNSSTGAVGYLHHDQQGSTSLLTGSTGTVIGKCAYGAYGSPTCEGSATTPLGFDGQYTSSDTGLIYLRARIYDPSTAQFLSVDPLEAFSAAPYNYARDNPLNNIDPSGLLSLGSLVEGVGIGLSCLAGPEVCGPLAVGALDYHVIKADVESVKTGCSPWAEITPAAIDTGVSLLPLGGGSVAKQVWDLAPTGYRVATSTGNAAGTLAGAVSSSSVSTGCGC